MALEKTRGAVTCAHCQTVAGEAGAVCPYCRRPVCGPCSAAGTCSEPQPRELRLGLGLRLVAVDERGRFGVAVPAASLGDPRLVDLDSGERSALTEAAAVRFEENGPFAIAGGRLAWWMHISGGQLDELDRHWHMVQETRLPLPRPQLHRHIDLPAKHLALLDDGRTVSASEDTVMAYDTEGDRELWRTTLQPEVVQAFAVSARLGLVVLGLFSKVAILRLDTGERVGGIYFVDEDLGCVTLGGDRLAAISAPGYVRVVAVDRARPPHRWETVHEGHASAFGQVSAGDASLSADGLLLAIRRRRKQVQVIRVEGGERQLIRRHTDRVILVRFVRGGQMLVSADRDNRVCLWPRAGDRIVTGE
jgi:hypothetical protein